jgi:hypothetical protein
MANEKLREYELVVEGKIPFPMDMLRYDACFPASESDSYMIDASINRYVSQKNVNGRYSVRLKSRRLNRAWAPTGARWASFSWTVVSYREVT